MQLLTVCGWLICIVGAWCESSQHGESAPLICCGDKEVFILGLERDRPAVSDRTWRWRATDSPQVPEDKHDWFRSTDECKPYKDSILITASSGGVALIRRSDKACLFLAYGRNAHSACLMPDRRIAVASSFGGDEMLLFEQGDSTEEAEPIARLPLIGAHGVVWDNERERLWALGNERLLLLDVEADGETPSFVIEGEWQLPTPGGHDLSTLKDPAKLFVTSGKHVYRFDKETGEFELDEEIGDLGRVKSVTQNSATGEIVYHQAIEGDWASDTIRFVGERKEIIVENERLYKVRWDLPDGDF